jgi:hypothetical protein
LAVFEHSRGSEPHLNIVPVKGAYSSGVFTRLDLSSSSFILIIKMKTYTIFGCTKGLVELDGDCFLLLIVWREWICRSWKFVVFLFEPLKRVLMVWLIKKHVAHSLLGGQSGPKEEPFFEGSYGGNSMGGGRALVLSAGSEFRVLQS